MDLSLLLLIFSHCLLSHATPLWISDGSDEVEIDDNVVSCGNCSTKSRNEYNAMWKDDDGYNSGEHYWKIQFEDLESEFPVMVGVSNKAKFRKGFNSEGLFYKGNSHRCPSRYHSSQIFEFGPLIQSGDSVGILVSFEEDKKLQIYFYINDSPLGMAFNIDASLLPGINPVVQFTGPGSATITKETKLPSSRLRVSDEFEGDWKLIRNKTSFYEDVFDFDEITSFLYNPDIAFLTVTQAGENIFDVCLSILNYFSFQVEKVGEGWKKKEIFFHSHLWGTPELDEFERNLKDLTIYPDSVKIKNEELVFESGNKTTSFEKRIGVPRVIKRNPFQ